MQIDADKLRYLGLARRVDDLGRVSIPKVLRDAVLGPENEQSVEMVLCRYNGEKVILMRKLDDSEE